MKWCVYLHYRLDSGECFYIGKGTLRRANRVDQRNDYWCKIFKKAGRKVVFADWFDNEQAALDFEVQMIARYSPVANITSGGEGVSGLKHSSETLEKCRQSTLKLRQNQEWLSNNLFKMKQAVSTEENRKLLSKIGRERFEMFPEKRTEMSIKQRKFIMNNPEASAERQKKSQAGRQTHRAKLNASIAQGGKPFVAIKDNTETVYEVMADCSRELGLHSAAIHRCLRGKQKAHKGYTFKYKE